MEEGRQLPLEVYKVSIEDVGLACSPGQGDTGTVSTSRAERRVTEGTQAETAYGTWVAKNFTKEASGAEAARTGRGSVGPLERVIRSRPNLGSSETILEASARTVTGSLTGQRQVIYFCHPHLRK